MPNLKLIVEVCHAIDLPTKGLAGSSVCVEVSFDSQKQRTKSKASSDLNPVWGERLEFNVSDSYLLEEEAIVVNVFTEKKGKSRQLVGKAKVEHQNIYRGGTSGAEMAVGYPLRPWNLLPITKGEIFLKVYYYDEDGNYKDSVLHKGKKSEYAASTARSVPRGGPDLHGSFNAPSVGPDNLQPLDSISKSFDFGTYRDAGDSFTHSDFDVKAANNSTSSRRNDAVLLRNEQLVVEMEYLFVRIEKARGLAARDASGSSDPFVEIKVGNTTVKTQVVPQNLEPAWNEVFAIAKDLFSANYLEITVWDKDTIGKDFLGFVGFEIGEIPERRPPDSPLAPQWHRLEPRGEHKKAQGEIMLSVWIGTQADEAFPHARQSDSGWESHTRSKIYLSPKLWYLRVVVHQAQDLVAPRDNQLPDSVVIIELTGPTTQKYRTKPSASRQSGNSVWNEEIILIAAEPFTDGFLHISIVEHMSINRKDGEVMGFQKIPLLPIFQKRSNHQLEHRNRRVEPRPQWYDLERDYKDLKDVAQDVTNKMTGNTKAVGRILLTLCMEGGYHVLDESTLYTSDTLPAEKGLWGAPVAVLELGVLGALALHSTKTRDGRSCTDAYCVAKYGQKWIRTRTVLDSHDPQWNEQYTWEVYDPCTVLTIGVFDNHHLTGEKVHGVTDEIIGKIRIRLSTLETNRTYSHKYPLLMLDKTGLKKKGEIDLVVRLTCIKRMDMMQVYMRPLLPPMHYVKPFHMKNQDKLREVAIQLVVARLSRSEPKIRREVVKFMLDVDASRWSVRRSKANWWRIRYACSTWSSIWSWFQDICKWKNPVTTWLVYILYIILVWYPELLLPTFFLYMFLIGLWQYRTRPRQPVHMNVELSMANSALPEDLEEEFDPVSSAKQLEVVLWRYSRLQNMAAQIQNVVGDIATQLERLQALLNWRDPRATSVFIVFCLVAAIALYLIPFRYIAVFGGFYVLRPPRFRNGMPPVPLNFFKRLPSLADSLL